MVRAKARGLDANRVLDLGIYIIISALIGAKLLLLITDFRTFTANPRELLTLARSGGVFYGGLILAVAVALSTSASVGLPLWTTTRRVRAGHRARPRRRPLRLPVRRLLLRQADDAAVGITFTDPFAAANVGTPLGVPLHPTQLYEAGAELLILGVLLVTRAQGPAVRRADVLALHAALRHLALHHRVLSRRRARHGRHVLDLAVHLDPARAAGDRHAACIYRA